MTQGNAKMVAKQIPAIVLWTDKLDDLSSCRGLEPIQTHESVKELVPQFGAEMRKICEESNREGHGADWRNQHPQAQNFVRKRVAITGSREGMNVGFCRRTCLLMAPRFGSLPKPPMTMATGLPRRFFCQMSIDLFQETKRNHMGLTIHYQFQSDATTLGEARQLVEQLRRHALELPLESVGEVIELEDDQTDFETLEQGDPNRWLLIQAGEYVVQGDQYYPVKPKQVIAFSTWPGEGCEEANFGLCRYPATIDVRGRQMQTNLSGWCWSSFCKTQYASDPSCGGVENFLRCHLSVIRLLDHAANLGFLGKVSDEGGFWEKRDIEALVKDVGEWNQHMAAFVGNLKDQLGGEFVAPITEFPDFEHLEAKGRDKRKNK